MLLSEVCRASRARPILPAQRWIEANEKYSGYQQIRRSTRTIFSDSVDYETNRKIRSHTTEEKAQVTQRKVNLQTKARRPGSSRTALLSSYYDITSVMGRNG